MVKNYLEKLLASDPDSDLHQNQIISSLWYTQALHQISSESVHDFLRYFVHKQTDRGENITSVYLQWVEVMIS